MQGPTLEEQLAELTVTGDRPLLILDVDEVLLQFMVGLEPFLERHGLYFDFSSYALEGNIRHRHDQSPMPGREIWPLLDKFFAEGAHDLDVVDHAPATVERLTQHMEVVILTNLPSGYRPLRQACLADRDIHAPIICNHGLKGPAVKALADQSNHGAFFIDDSPKHHTSVAEHAPAVVRIHCVADPRLAALLAPADHSHARLDDWPSIEAYLLAQLGE